MSYACVEQRLISFIMDGYTYKAMDLLRYNTTIDVNWRDDKGRTAMTEAAYFGPSTLVKKLLELNASVNAQDDLWRKTPLMHATFKGRDDVVDMLLEKGAIVDVQDSEKKTAIDIARERGYSYLSKKLEMVRTFNSIIIKSLFSIIHDLTWKLFMG